MYDLAKAEKNAHVAMKHSAASVISKPVQDSDYNFFLINSRTTGLPVITVRKSDNPDRNDIYEFGLSYSLTRL